jgi:hypothetical protein
MAAASPPKPLPMTTMRMNRGAEESGERRSAAMISGAGAR